MHESMQAMLDQRKQKVSEARREVFRMERLAATFPELRFMKGLLSWEQVLVCPGEGARCTEHFIVADKLAFSFVFEGTRILFGFESFGDVLPGFKLQTCITCTTAHFAHDPNDLRTMFLRCGIPEKLVDVALREVGDRFCPLKSGGNP